MITVAQGLVTFEDAEGQRASVSMTDLIKRADPGELLAFGSFFQLVEANQRLQLLIAKIGHVEPEKAEGSGLLGQAFQQSTTLIEISAHLGALAESFKDLRDTSAEAAENFNPEKAMDKAMALAGSVIEKLGGPAGLAQAATAAELLKQSAGSNGSDAGSG